MTYAPPTPRPRAELEADLASGDVRRTSTALIDAAHHEHGAWALTAVRQHLRDRPLDVRRTALVATMALVRRGVIGEGPELDEIVAEARTTPELGGTLEDLLDDVAVFGRPSNSASDDDASP